ncbi:MULTISPECIES: sensor histidine kinase [unclassified Marinobacter]|uniref:sensor histidine kinase n=1 Tax=unclassified Marinobacter TaxID=83889 RepID=UPI001929095E|nr:MULTISPECIES: HAMP domain-containing sensor histidine kinase [unclassified Marinobacter]MBL3827302.1 HAMP domain-containing histidine kinase [Marinobacter sp. MC3]MBL3895820.1 HAMP domain-containing histidine kinase [Marinobacter sp. MW3]
MQNENKTSKKSVAARLARTIFILVSATTAIAMFAVDFFIDDADDTILNLELRADTEFFEEQLKAGTFRSLKTPRLEVLFVPTGKSDSELPSYFQGLNLPHADEFEENGVTKQVFAKEIENPAGQLYLAQDTTILESRQGLIQWILLGITGVMFFAAFFFSRVSANYIVRPLKRLTHEIQSIEPSKNMRRCNSDYDDREIADIADSFNRFLSELESHIERERSFVKLASHELRTPLAVISGALEVLDQRGDLSGANQKTINRIRTTTHAMKDDIEVLLALARSEDREETNRRFSVYRLASDLVADLEQGTPQYQGRVKLKGDDKEAIVAPPSLVRMLLRNLIQNALRHTRSDVEITIKTGEIIVRDFGTGLPIEKLEQFSEADKRLFGVKQTGNFKNSTFGLLIVRMVAERLGWTLELLQSNHEGTEFRFVTGESTLSRIDQ